jgi:hypothetical protein
MKRRSLALPFVVTVAMSPLAYGETNPPPADPDGAPIDRRPDGTCWQHPSSHCPPNVHCNPGPPRQVKCPAEPKKAPDQPKK